MNIVIKIILWIAYFISLYFAVFWFIVFLSKTTKLKKKVLKKFSLVSIVIPAFNEEKIILPTLESLIKLDYPKNKLEILVVNDGSTDKTKGIVKNFINKNKNFYIKLINQKNKGKGTALNNGLKNSKGEFFIVLDADSYAKKNALKRILPEFSDKDVAAVLPLLKVRKPKNLLQRMQWFEYLINMFYKELMGKLDCIHVAPGPFSAYRKVVLEKIGGFDENNLTEDLEISLRLQNYNYKIVQLLDAEVCTIAPKTFKELYKQRNRWYKGAIFNALKYKHLFFNKKYGDFGLIQMPTILIAGIVAIVLIASLLYYSLKPLIEYFYNMGFVGFDFYTLIKNFTININILDLNYTTILIAIVMLFITIVIINKAHIETKERVIKYGIFSLITYVLLYFLLLGFIWIGITIDLITGRKQKW